MGHGERRRELERQFPGWDIWYVPREPDSATWCARPQMLIGAESPERRTGPAAAEPVAETSQPLAGISCTGRSRTQGRARGTG